MRQKKSILGRKRTYFLLVKNVRERERKKKKKYKLLSSIYGVLSIGICRAKSESYLLDEGYAWVPKMRDFTEDPKEEISGNQIFSGLGGVLKTSFGFIMLQEIRILPIFGLYFILRAVWLCFMP